MKSPLNGPLLDDLLAGDESARFRASSFQSLHALARRRRRQRALGRALAGTTLLAIAAISAAFWFRTSVTSAPRPAAQGQPVHLPPGTPAPALAASAGPTGVRCLTDDELLSLFPGRPVALLGPPGAQRFVFLDDLRTARRIGEPPS